MTSFATKIDRAYHLSPRFFGDARGFFLKKNFAKLAINADFLPNNHSRWRKLCRLGRLMLCDLFNK